MIPNNDFFMLIPLALVISFVILLVTFGGGMMTDRLVENTKEMELTCDEIVGKINLVEKGAPLGIDKDKLIFELNKKQGEQNCPTLIITEVESRR